MGVGEGAASGGIMEKNLSLKPQSRHFSPFSPPQGICFEPTMLYLLNTIITETNHLLSLGDLEVGCVS